MQRQIDSTVGHRHPLAAVSISGNHTDGIDSAGVDVGRAASDSGQGPLDSGRGAADSGRNPSDSAQAASLLVVGPAFFEAFVPTGVKPVPGTEQFVDSITLGLGGALNSATVSAALGVDTTFMYPRTTWVVDGAITECCRLTGVRGRPWGGGVEPYVTLVWTDRIDRAFVSSCDWGPFSSCPAFPRAQWVHVGGLSEFWLLEERIVEAVAAGARVSTCAGWDPPSLERLRTESRCLLEVLFLNRAEAEMVCGTVDRALDLLPGHAARDVVVTDGSAGARAVVGGRQYSATAPVVQVVDPTGAGDAFAAAWIARSLAEMDTGAMPDPAARLHEACRVASMVVGIKGGVVVDRSQVTSR